MSKNTDQTNNLPEKHPVSPPRGYYLPYPPYPEEGEVHLLDLLIVLLKHKFLIVGIVFLTGIGAVIVSLAMTNIYRSEATIIPRQEEQSTGASALSALGGLGAMAGGILGLGGSGSLEKFDAVLKSRILSKKVFEKHKLEILPVLYEQDWDTKNKKWRQGVDEPPTEQDVIKSMMEIFSIFVDSTKGTLSLKFDHKNPAFAKAMVDWYLEELSESLREETLKDAFENQRFLKTLLDQTADALLEEKIYSLLAKEIEKETFARGQKPYSYQILDPPIVPDPDKKISPKRSLICILSVFAAFVFSVCLAFFLEYIENARTNQDSERIDRFKNSLKIKSD